MNNLLKHQIRLKMQDGFIRANAGLSDVDYQCFERPELQKYREKIKDIKRQISQLNEEVVNDKILDSQ